MTTNPKDSLIIGGREFTSRLFTGTGKFRSNDQMAKAIKASGTQMVTVAMKRIDMERTSDDDMLGHIIHAADIQLLPNTSGVRDAAEAVLAAQLAREAFGTDFIKLEIHPDPRYLLPDPVETLKATEELARMGFVVLPYIQADPVLCKRLEEAGAATVMPLAAPIGSNRGLVTRELLRIIIEQSRVPVVVDAGLGAPPMPPRPWRWAPMPCWSTLPLPWPAIPKPWPAPLPPPPRRAALPILPDSEG